MANRPFLGKYWFKPAKLGWVAVYYPVLFPGWVLTFICLFFLFYFFVIATLSAATLTGMLFYFLLRAVIIFLIYDLACFRMGEYPYWWRKKN